MEEPLIYLAAFVTLVTVAVAAAIIAVRRDGRNAGELVKQLIIWVALAALLPLTSYAGATLLHSPAKLNDLLAQQQRAQMEVYDTDDPAARGISRDRAEAIQKQIDDERREFYRAMFWVGGPIGFVALIVGLFLHAVPVGAGLAFGGLCTLTSGCYSYWNDMGDALRFISLLIVLVTVIAIGLTKFGRPATE